MSSVTRVPQTRTMDEADLSADDARTTLRHYGRWPLVRDSFVRFRYGDGFSHSRALALQLVLSLIPLGIAFIGLSSTLRAESIGQVIREVLLRVTPGSTDEVVRETIERGEANVGHGELALFARSRGRRGRADHLDGTGGARSQPHLRHPARPADPAQVRPGRPARRVRRA